MSNRKNYGMTFLSCLVIYYIVLSAHYNITDNANESVIFTSLLLLYNVISFFIVITLHELGHFIVGKILKYQFISFTIVFFSFVIENEKIKFKLRAPKTFWGYCMMSPNLNSFYGYLFYIAGGVVINIVTGLLFLILAINLNSFALFFWIITIQSLLIAIINIIPIKKINYSNDGWNIRNAISNKGNFKEYIEEVRNSKIKATISRPKEFDAELDKTEKFNWQYHLVFYYKALDSNDIDTIQYCGNLFEENFDMANDATFLRFCYVVIHSACVTGDIDTAKEYYEKCKRRISNDNDCNGLRVKAYYEYYVNKDNDYAHELCRQGISVADKFVSEIQGVMEKDLMINLQNLIINESKQTT